MKQILFLMFFLKEIYRDLFTLELQVMIIEE